MISFHSTSSLVKIFRIQRCSILNRKIGYSKIENISSLVQKVIVLRTSEDVLICSILLSNHFTKSFQKIVSKIREASCHCLVRKEVKVFV